MKNTEYVIKKTAADLNLPVETVRPIIMEYWKAGMGNLVGLKKTTTSIRGIGLFTVSRYKLYNYIRKMIGKIRKLESATDISEEKRTETLASHRKNLSKALVERNILAIHYQKRFKNRKIKRK